MEGAPGKDELEVSLFGPGYGESLAVHLGDDQWMLVDSCVGRGNDEPAAVEYLDALGVDVAEKVVAVVATHWHDDHVRGLATVVERCERARFSCSSALGHGEFLTLVESPALSTMRVTSGTRELARVFDIARERKRRGVGRAPDLLRENTIVFRSESCEVLALSPSAAAVERTLRAFADLLPEALRPHLRVPPINPNPASVALWVRGPAGSALLGADLEADDAEDVGWKAVLALEPAAEGLASLFKIPHHGAESGDEADVWDELLVPSPAALLTPWQLGGRSLPSERDRERLCSLAPAAVVVGVANAGTVRYGGAVERTLKETVRWRRPAMGPVGHVRARLKPGDEARWRVDLVRNASRLCQAA